MKNYYDRARTLSIYWKNRANDYHAAAIVLDEAAINQTHDKVLEQLGAGFNLGCALPSVIGFIFATAIELSLKACIVQKLFNEHLIRAFQTSNKKTLSEDDVEFTLSRNFFTHDLQLLADKLGLKLTPKEKIFLEVLTNQIYKCGKGRYPIPLSEEEYEKYISFCDKSLYLKVSNGQENISKMMFKKRDPETIIAWQNYEKMWHKLEKLYVKLNP